MGTCPVLTVNRALQNCTTPVSFGADWMMTALSVAPCVRDRSSARERNFDKISPIDSVSVRLAVIKCPCSLVGQHNALEHLNGAVRLDVFLRASICQGPVVSEDR